MILLLSAVVATFLSNETWNFHTTFNAQQPVFGISATCTISNTGALHFLHLAWALYAFTFPDNRLLSSCMYL